MMHGTLPAVFAVRIVLASSDAIGLGEPASEATVTHRTEVGDIKTNWMVHVNVATAGRPPQGRIGPARRGAKPAF
jgi:hypothetical protein